MTCLPQSYGNGFPNDASTTRKYGKDCTNRKLNIARASQVEYCVIFAIAHVGRFERGRTGFLSSISQVYDAR